MDVLKSLFGNVTSSILRLAVIAGTVALIYVFVIKPALDTSKEISEQIGSGANDVSRSIQQSIRQQIPSSTNQQIQRQINQALQQTTQPGGANPQALLRCVKRANGDVQKLQICTRLFG